ncbi:AMP-binding protein [Kerstersia gyiorum]|uniref:AMP-binding protein n=1 Tax=Kerstersia gyiorum TaxID=206506 RepID=UPI00209E1E33|nr:AMP-binding protein [Kerstersia gyiorum]MCP1679290.1 acetyl-CoA synthetase [Kerstersia gyiorum]MCP1823793.1 acetyl-CoA synthetase [Kerstersia gyiorum]MCP1827234.1 acetyl-CoA synthetase [Kerstersia gyiorum]MCW2449117.1 acetyl-CoA synthetase [Kerstersia gyiorum]
MNDQYSQLYESFRWLLPAQFNLAQPCCVQWAISPSDARRVALVVEKSEGDATTWQYGQLQNISSRLAGGMARMGVQRGDRVALLLSDPAYLVIAALAAWTLGAIVMPLSARLSPTQLAQRLRQAAPRVVVLDDLALAAYLAERARLPAGTRLVGQGMDSEHCIAWKGLLARQPNGLQPVPLPPDAPAMLHFPPEAGPHHGGVLLPHSALIGNLPAFVASLDWFPRGKDRLWVAANWSQADVLLGAVLPALYFGATAIAITQPPDAASLLSRLYRLRISDMIATQDTLREFCAPGHPPLPLASLNAIAAIVTDAYLETDMQRCQELLGRRPNAVYGVHGMYGLAGDSGEKWPVADHSPGRPYPGHYLAALDPADNELPPGVQGELALRQYDRHGHADPLFPVGIWQQGEIQPAPATWMRTGLQAALDSEGRIMPLPPPAAEKAQGSHRSSRPSASRANHRPAPKPKTPLPRNRRAPGSTA